MKSTGKFLATLGVLATLTACAMPASKSLELRSVRDHTGCELDIVASEPGQNHFQYDSFDQSGNWLAVGWDNGEEQRGTYLLDLRSGERVPVPKLNNGATFSPDGQFLLNAIYVENGKTDIALVDRETGNLTVLAPHDDWDWLPSFSPDGNHVVFNSYRTGNSDVYLYDLKTNTETRITSSEQYEAHAQISPDGNTVMFHRRLEGGDFNIYHLDLASGEEKQVTHEPTEESYASWSPDGRYVVFASDREREPGNTDLYIMTAAGEVVRRLTDAPEKDAYPFWSPDGRYIYFNSYREPRGIYRMAVTNLIDCRLSGAES